MVAAAQTMALTLQYRAILKIIHAITRSDRNVPPAFFTALANSLLKSDRAAAIDSFAEALRGADLTGVQVDTLLRASLSTFIGNEIPQHILSTFEEISGGGLHYSQEGEDVLLARILPSEETGYFVDIGAHHPLRFSNTYALYRKGWRGINLDATPGSMEVFKKLRPEDINIECAVSDADNPMTFHVFKEGALNTFDASLAKEYVDSGWPLECTVEIRPRTLSSILDEHLPAGKHIDLLNIDVEGEEMGVLRSNNWHSYRPDLIILEVLATPFASLKTHPTVVYLADKGYETESRLANSVLLRRQK